MTFSDSDWTREPPLRVRTPPSQRRVMVLAIAIAVSCVAIAMAVFSIEQLFEASSRDAALRHVGDAVIAAPTGAGVAAPAASAPAPSEAPSSAQAASPAASSSAAAGPAGDVDAQQLAALEAEMRQRARDTAQHAAVEAERRKERAWLRFYQRPDFCADNPTAAQMVQCANQYIRARREFEERYAAGRL